MTDTETQSLVEDDGAVLETQAFLCSGPSWVKRNRIAQMSIVFASVIAMIAIFSVSVHWSNTTDRKARDYYKIIATNAFLPIRHVNATFTPVNTGVTTAEGLHIYSQRLPDLDFPQFMTFTLLSTIVLYIGVGIASASWTILRKNSTATHTNGNIGILGFGVRFFVDPILVFIACVILRQPYLTTRMDLVILTLSAWSWSVWTERDYYEYFYPSDTKFKSSDPLAQNKQAIGIGQVRSFLAALVAVGFKLPVAARLWSIINEINGQREYVHLTTGELAMVSMIIAYFLGTTLLSLFHAFPTAWLPGLNSKHGEVTKKYPKGRPFYTDVIDAHVYTAMHLLMTTSVILGVWMTWVIAYPAQYSWSNN